MNAVPAFKPTTAKVIELSEVIRVMDKKKEIRFNKDGTIDKRHSNKVAGVSSEVYPFQTEEEIKAMIDVLNSKIDNAPDDDKLWIATRNKLIFLVGINVGLRASDLVPIKWSFFYNEDGTFKDFYVLQPKKTQKAKKFVKIFFNQTVENYVNDYPFENLDEYVFKSRKGGAITEKSLWKIIVDTTSEAKLKLNYGTHSLRKTWAYTIWHNAEDKHKALVMLQQCLSHSDSMTTMRYIGILDEEKKDMYESVEIGLDFI